MVTSTTKSPHRTVRDFFIQNLIKQYSTKLNTTLKVVDFSILGNLLYLLLTDTEKNFNFIRVIKCSKHLDEFTCEHYDDHLHPPFFDCPIKLLARANSPNQKAQNWYLTCSTLQAHKKEIRKIIEQLKSDTKAIGKTLILKPSRREVEYIKILDNTSFLARCKQTNQTHRWHINFVSVDEWRKLVRLG